jgi:hypothetical protein
MCFCSFCQAFDQGALKKYLWLSNGGVEFAIVDDVHLDPETSSG